MVLYCRKRARTHTHTHTHTHIHTRVHVCAHACTHTRSHTHTHAHTCETYNVFCNTTCQLFLYKYTLTACFSYIERFRHGAPMSREERVQMEGNQKSEFWWLQSSPPTPNSTSTPKEGEGRSLPMTNQGRGGLTMENLRRRDDLDSATDHLQQKAERLLHR